MESMLYQGHRVLGGIKHVWTAVRVWKTNLVLEDLARQKTDENVTKVRDLVRSGRRLTVRMISSALNLNSQTVHEILTFELGKQKICAKLVQKILTNEQKENRVFGQKGISVVPQPPYSPDLSPCYFFLFPKLKFHLKGRHFGTVDDIEMVVTDQLRALLHEDFQHCYREWEQHLRRCVASQGNYFEGDNVDLWVNVKLKNI